MYRKSPTLVVGVSPAHEEGGQAVSAVYGVQGCA